MMTSWEYIYYGNKMNSQATMRISKKKGKKEEKEDR